LQSAHSGRVVDPELARSKIICNLGSGSVINSGSKLSSVSKQQI
jgi:hypothetical protein